MDGLSPLHICSSLVDYTVAFSDLADLSRWCPQADALLVDAFFRGRLRFPETVPVIWIEATEEAKSLPATLSVFVALKQAGFGRGSHLAAIGGGVVQDIATFVASLYMRGIGWSYAPTTFLGMADSCLGGKSSINVGSYKNLIGNFHPPTRIDILPAFARTLPQVEMACGAAEAAKIAFCRGNSTFRTYEQLASPLLDGSWNERQLAELIHATLAVKQWFIETDEFDRAERRLLNFGHTWGHALESATDFAIPHGLAVAVGMMAAILFLADGPAQPSSSRLFQHCLVLLCPVLIREQLNGFDADRFLKALRADKKHSAGQLHLIVPGDADDRLGVKEMRLPAGAASENSVLAAMQQALTTLLSLISADGTGPAHAAR
jgi:3-dehydroquinate synthase